jgi:hypothetical protein
MTQYIFIASPIKLHQGDFGSNPVSKEQPNVYNTELDFTHLYFENNYDSKLKKKFSFSNHLTYEFQVTAYANQVPLKGRETGSTYEKKCLDILYGYVEKAIFKGGHIEMFTCWNGEENNRLSNYRKVYWKDIKSPYDLVLNDLEIVEIIL